MTFVLDTNVIVSGVLKPTSVPARLLDLAIAGKIPIACCEQLLAEYRTVLLRPKFAFDPWAVDQLVAQISARASHVVAMPQALRSTDPKDQIILDLAVTTGAWLVTGNIRHFSSYDRAVSPAAAIEIIANEGPCRP